MRVVERMARSRGDEAGGAFIWELPSRVARESCKACQQLAKFVFVFVWCRWHTLFIFRLLVLL